MIFVQYQKNISNNNKYVVYHAVIFDWTSMHLIFVESIIIIASFFYQWQINISSLFGNIDWKIPLISITKSNYADNFFLSISRTSLILTGNFMSLKSSFLAESLPVFLIYSVFLCTWCIYWTKYYLKHSLLSSFWMLIKPFSEWFGNLI